MRALTIVLAVTATLSAHAQCSARFDSAPAYIHGFLLTLGDFDNDGHVDTLTAMPGESAVRVNLGRSDGTFDRGSATPMRAPLGDEPHLFDAVTGDWNEDGLLDAVVGSESLHSADLLLGRGDGTFEPAQSIAAFLWVRTMAAADFDNDDHLDLVVSDPDADLMTIHWGNGDGTFVTGQQFELSNVVDVVAGDLDRDGRDDLVAGSGSAGLEVFLAQSGRTFTRPQHLDVQRDHWGMVLRDIDGDGRLDLGLADLSAFVVSTFRGNGDGTFQERADMPAGAATEGIAFGEFTGDDVLDIVAGNGPEGHVVVLAGRGDGQYDTYVPHQAGGNLWGVYVEDLNGDGLDDVIASDYGGYNVLLQNEAHAFPHVDTIRAAYVSYETVVADFNRDGRPDVAVADLEGSSASILRGRGDGTLEYIGLAGLGASPISLATADVNGDQIADLVAGAKYQVSIALGRGDGSFDPGGFYLIEETPRYYTITTGDIDGDGDVDIAAVDRTINAIRFLRNDGTGLFVETPDAVFTGTFAARPLLVDVNHDSILDLIHASDTNGSNLGGTGLLHVRLGRGNGKFDELVNVATSLDPWDVRASDFDGDGHVDLIVTSWHTKGDASIYRNDGTGSFTHAATLPAFGQALDVAIADFDRDGRPDVAMNNGRLVYVYENSGGFDFRWPVAHVAAESPFTIGAADFDGDGWTDITTGGFFGEISVQRNKPLCRQRVVRH